MPSHAPLSHAPLMHWSAAEQSEPEGSLGKHAAVIVLHQSPVGHSLSLLQPVGTHVIEVPAQVSLRHWLALVQGPSPFA